MLTHAQCFLANTYSKVLSRRAIRNILRSSVLGAFRWVNLMKSELMKL